MANIQQTFIPGSEWLYFKIYTGIKNADKMLIEQIQPLVKMLITERLISEYFFIRYNDPEFHIRLRLKLTSRKNHTEVFKLFYSFFSEPVADGLIWKVQCDTYKRELKRYGENNIEICESIFYIDSETIIKFLRLLNQTTNADRSRWLFAIQIIDQYFTIMKFDMLQKSNFINRMSDNYCYEFGLTNNDRLVQLNNKFRENRKIIEEIFRENPESFQNLLAWRKLYLTPSLQTLSNVHEQNPSPKALENILASLIHMTLNRLFRSRNRLCEMVIYYYLRKYYKSEIARNKY